MTDEGYEVSLIRKTRVNASERVVYVAINIMFDATLNCEVYPFNDIDRVLTNLDAENPTFKKYSNAGLNLV